MDFCKLSNLPLSLSIQRWKTLSCSGLRIDRKSRPPSPTLSLLCLSTGLAELLCRKKHQHGDCSTLHSALSFSTEIANDSKCNQLQKSCGFSGMGTCPLGSALKPPMHFTGSARDPSNTNNIQSLLTRADFGPDAWKWNTTYPTTRPCHKSIIHCTIWNQ